ncbi:MAG: pth [Nitrososphaera sp.]|jgi:PTH2 family peptidyl-tRNA hydrolase|nr:pth [Nitrososphaera sp.]MDQ5830903.1 peptidyl-tRNA hydrolase Pth2 [Thermoproteota archaeon]
MSKQVSDMDFKQVIIVRRDVNMGTGKIAAQVAHAAVMGAEKVKASRREWFNSWFAAGQAKVVVKVKSIEELMDVRMRAEELNLPVVQVHDSGLTQIPSGTITCVGIGPAPSELIDKVTFELKLL